MTPDQVAGLFSAGEQFVEGTIAAALVVLWIAALGLHVARPFMVRSTEKFTLRLGADLWWIIYVGLRDIFLVQVFLGSFIFFYPDVLRADQLPVTGSLAAVCAFAVMLIKLTTRNDGDPYWFRWQLVLLAVGATLYVVPYIIGVQATLLTGQHVSVIVPGLVTSTNTAVAIPLGYLSAVLVGVLGLVAVGYNLRIAGRRPTIGA
ncbi:MAG TPA: hypothetical protein VF802_00200 [Candidatus Limnocylindrales bacterium]